MIPEDRVTCSNCGIEYPAYKLIPMNTGRRQLLFCPKCYRRGTGEAEARNNEAKRIRFLKYEADKRRRGR